MLIYLSSLLRFVKSCFVLTALQRIEYSKSPKITKSGCLKKEYQTLFRQLRLCVFVCFSRCFLLSSVTPPPPRPPPRATRNRREEREELAEPPPVPARQRSGGCESEGTVLFCWSDEQFQHVSTQHLFSKVPFYTVQYVQ